MSLSKIRKDQSGFTIVEVMIVLAIAGLVLAIVFIAVPNLQRNSRNSSRRADLALLRAQFDTWTGTNGGKLPRVTSPVSTDFTSIINGTGWSHYNGNGILPGTVTLGQATPAHCNGATNASGVLLVMQPTSSGPCEDANGDGTIGNLVGMHQDGVWTALSGAQTAEYIVGYVRNRDPSATPAVQYPDRNEIHIWGEMQCASGILVGGNDTDDNGGVLYAGTDVVASNARALAFVYQVEGEDNARCEDNV